MKHLTVFFALSTLVLAQPRRGGPAMAMLDADHDGVITAAEWRNAPAALAKLDANGDGKVSADELRPPGPPPGEGGPRGPGGPDGEDMAARMMSFDKDGDGKLSAAELPERMQGMMERADKNKDGFLTKDELTAAEPPRGGGGGGPRGGMMRMDPILSAVDADQDGTLSAAEIQGSAAAIAKLDKDGDGKLTREEVRPAFGGRGGRGPRQ